MLLDRRRPYTDKGGQDAVFDAKAVAAVAENGLKFQTKSAGQDVAGPA